MVSFNRKFLIFFFCFLVSSINSFSVNSLVFKNFTVEDGLSSNTIQDIAQDKDGRIWFATYSGLTYFDGTSFRVLPPLSLSDSNVFPTGKPEDIEVDSQGSIWVLFEGNKLVRLLNLAGACKLYQPFEQNTSNSIQITLDADGVLLVDSRKALWKYDVHKDRFEPFASASYISPSVAFERERLKMVPIVPLSDVFSIKHVSDGIWVTTLSHGIFFAPGGDFSKTVNYTSTSPGSSAISSNEVYCLLVDNSGTVWAGTKDHGLNKGVLNRSSFHTFGAKQLDIAVGATRALARDRGGRLWIGTYSHGVAVWNGKKTKPIVFKDENASKWNWIRCIYKTVDGQMWVGSYGGLCQVDPVSFRLNYFDSKSGDGKESLTASRIYSIVEDRKQNLFIGEWGGLDYLDRATGKITRVDDRSELKDANIRKLMLDTKGMLWVGTETRGVYVVDATTFRLRAHYTFQEGKKEGLGSNSIFEICEDKEGNVWIGSFGGLNCIKPDGSIQSYPDINVQLPSTLIYRIFPGKSGELWCSTIKGIAHIDLEANRVRAYDETDGSEIAEFSEGAGLRDVDGTIYFGGINGINYFHPDSIQKDAFSPGIVMDGLLVNDKIRVVDYPFDLSSPLELASWENDLSVSLNTVSTQSPQKSKIAWRLEPVAGQFELADGPNFVIKYHDLAPGSYTLLVKAANADGLWSPEKKVISFVVARPFWQEFYFISACFLVFVFAGVWAVRSRFAQIKRINKRLEELVEQRTEKIEKQKIELEKSNEVLAERSREMAAQKDQILAQRDHLLEMYDKQEEMNRLKENFFTNISHDIRTPLSLIYAPVSEILKDQSLLANQKSKLETIYSNTQYVLQLLDQVLDRKKLETGGLEKVMTLGEVVQVCGAIVESFQVQAKTNEVTLNFESAQEELNIRFDFGKLKQIVYNILANAMKFTPKGGHINCRIEANAASFQITIQDTGIGIPEDRKKYIFERYYQIGKSQNGNNPGAGIGLSLVKEFVLLLDGEIEVESSEGKGSTFRVTFPFMLNEPAVTSPAMDEAEMSESTMLQAENGLLQTAAVSRQMEVLLVEDNRDLRNYLKSYLEQHFRVTALENGAEALLYMKKNHTVSAIVSDWIMPELDGIELCRTIRRKTRFKSLPFILLTALTDLTNEKEGYFAGIDDFVAKPFDPELLYLKILRLVKQQELLTAKLKAAPVLEPENKPVETYDDKLLKKMAQVVEKHLAETDFDSAVLAEECGMSAMQLYRKLRELSQMTPSEFIRTVRMKRAMQLMANASIQVNEVSDMVGFNDPKYFSRIFTKIAGMSPSAYREQLLRNQLTID